MIPCHARDSVIALHVNTGRGGAHRSLHHARDVDLSAPRRARIVVEDKGEPYEKPTIKDHEIILMEMARSFAVADGSSVVIRIVEAPRTREGSSSPAPVERRALLVTSDLARYPHQRRHAAGDPGGLVERRRLGGSDSEGGKLGTVDTESVSRGAASRVVHRNRRPGGTP